MASLAELNLPEDLLKAVKAAVGTIVALAQPEQVILFGPWTEGGAHEDCPVDIMVVADAERRPMLPVQLADAVRPALQPRTCGLVVVPVQDWNKHRGRPGFLTHDVDRDGVKLYLRAT